MIDDRKHLTAREVEKLLDAAKYSRNASRDRCLLLLMFRHGLRVSEACSLRLSQVDTESRVLHVKRLKQGLSTTHPLRVDEIRAIKAWLTDRLRMKPDMDALFISERGNAISRKTVYTAIRNYGDKAVAFACPSPHAAPCLRFRPCRSRCGHATDSGLSRPPEYSTYR